MWRSRGFSRSGDDRRRPQPRLRIRLLLVSWRSHQSHHWDELSYHRLQAYICGSGPEEEGAPGSARPPTHDETPAAGPDSHHTLWSSSDWYRETQVTSCYYFTGAESLFIQHHPASAQLSMHQSSGWAELLKGVVHPKILWLIVQTQMKMFLMKPERFLSLLIKSR